MSDGDFHVVIANFDRILTGRISNVLCIIPIRIVSIIKDLKVENLPNRIEKKKIQQMDPMVVNDRLSKVIFYIFF